MTFVTAALPEGVDPSRLVSMARMGWVECCGVVWCGVVWIMLWSAGAGAGVALECETTCAPHLRLCSKYGSERKGKERKGKERKGKERTGVLRSRG